MARSAVGLLLLLLVLIPSGDYRNVAGAVRKASVSILNFMIPPPLIFCNDLFIKDGCSAVQEADWMQASCYESDLTTCIEVAQPCSDTQHFTGFVAFVIH